MTRLHASGSGTITTRRFQLFRSLWPFPPHLALPAESIGALMLQLGGIGLIGILIFAYTMPQAASRTERLREEGARSVLRRIWIDEQHYLMEHGNYVSSVDSLPATAAALDAAGTARLRLEIRATGSAAFVARAIALPDDRHPGATWEISEQGEIKEVLGE